MKLIPSLVTLAKPELPLPRPPIYHLPSKILISYLLDLFTAFGTDYYSFLGILFSFLNITSVLIPRSLYPLQPSSRTPDEYIFHLHGSAGLSLMPQLQLCLKPDSSSDLFCLSHLCSLPALTWLPRVKPCQTEHFFSLILSPPVPVSVKYL